MRKEKEKLLKKKNELQTKRKKKGNEDAMFNIQVWHLLMLLWEKSKTSYLWLWWQRKIGPRCCGCQKADSDTKFVIHYDCQNKLYSFKFSNF